MQINGRFSCPGGEVFLPHSSHPRPADKTVTLSLDQKIPVLWLPQESFSD